MRVRSGEGHWTTPRQPIDSGAGIDQRIHLPRGQIDHCNLFRFWSRRTCATLPSGLASTLTGSSATSTVRTTQQYVTVVPGSVYVLLSRTSYPYQNPGVPEGPAGVSAMGEFFEGHAFGPPSLSRVTLSTE